MISSQKRSVKRVQKSQILILFGLLAMSPERHFIESKPYSLDAKLHQFPDGTPNTPTALESAHFWLGFRGPRCLRFASLLKPFTHLHGIRLFLRKTINLQIPVVNGGPKLVNVACRRALNKRNIDPFSSILHHFSDVPPHAQTALDSGHFLFVFGGPRGSTFELILRNSAHLDGFERYFRKWAKWQLSVVIGGPTSA